MLRYTLRSVACKLIFTLCHSNLSLEGKLADHGTTKVDDLDDTVFVHDTVVQLQISVSNAHLVQIGNALDHTVKAAGNLVAAHVTLHHGREELVLSVFHHLIEAIVLLDDVNGLDDVGVVESGPQGVLSHDLLGVDAIRLGRTALAELLDGKGLVIRDSGQDTDRAASAMAQNLAHLPVFFMKISLE